MNEQNNLPRSEFFASLTPQSGPDIKTLDEFVSEADRSCHDITTGGGRFLQPEVPPFRDPLGFYKQQVERLKLRNTQLNQECDDLKMTADKCLLAAVFFGLLFLAALGFILL